MLRLFCSHSWDHDDHREGLHDLISDAWVKNRDWCDLSVPRAHPLHIRGNEQLATAISHRILRSDALIAFAGLYSTHSVWINFEVETAAWYRKPIIAVRPRGQERLSSVVMNNAWVDVGWNGKSVREAILDWIPHHRWRDEEPGLRVAELMAAILKAQRAKRPLWATY